MRLTQPTYIRISELRGDRSSNLSFSIAPGTSALIINDVPQLRVTCTLAREATLEWFDLTVEGDRVESDVTIYLAGEWSQTTVYGLFFGSAKQEFKLSHAVHHQAARTTSELLTKGVLNYEAKATYHALIKIYEEAAGCAGRQSEHTLLLSGRAQISAVPSLEIGNNDVKASHSVATTYLDEVKKFYLEARGLSEGESIQMIVRAHLAEVLEKIRSDELRLELEKSIATKLC